MPDFVRSGGVTMGNAVIEVKADSDGNPTECCNPVTGVCLGGGSSDLSTVEVVCTLYDSAAEHLLYCSGVNIYNDTLETEFICNDEFQDPPTPTVFVLYKNSASAQFEFDDISLVDIAVTGNVVLSVDDNFANFLISGDGSITVTLK